MPSITGRSLSLVALAAAAILAGCRSRPHIFNLGHGVVQQTPPEHVAALDFLNQNTTDDLNFFAVEVELWRIGDSPLAPKFEVVAKPNA